MSSPVASDPDRPARPEVPEFAVPLIVVGAMLAVMWALALVDLVPGVNFGRWGIRPRSWRGLLGIPVAPFLHTGIRHVVANTVPFAVLGAIVAWSNLARFIQVTVIVAVVGGLGVWLFGRPHTVHLGASGLVMGYFAYVLTRGLFARKPLWIAGGVLVALVFGWLWWSLLPTPGRSWTGHVFGAAAGVLAAYLGSLADRADADAAVSGRAGTGS